MYTVFVLPTPSSRTDFIRLRVYNHELKSNVEDYKYTPAEFFYFPKTCVVLRGLEVICLLSENSGR